MRVIILRKISRERSEKLFAASKNSNWSNSHWSLRKEWSNIWNIRAVGTKCKWNEIVVSDRLLALHLGGFTEGWPTDRYAGTDAKVLWPSCWRRSNNFYKHLVDADDGTKIFFFFLFVTDFLFLTNTRNPWTTITAS